MTPAPLTRDEPTDLDPAIQREAAERRTRPEFIDRDGFHRCPRCARVWPLDHYKPEHLTVDPRHVRARCRTCRAGVSRHLRCEAIKSGICEARGCSEPILDRYQCGRHLALSDAAARARRAPNPAPMKLEP